MKPTRTEPPQYPHRAPALRATMTDAETRLWQALRGRQVGDVRFRRQVPMGPYVVDFVCHAARLAARGYRVLRFWNNDVMENVEGVVATIATAVGERKPAE